MADVTITLKGVDAASDIIKGVGGAIGSLGNIVGGAVSVAFGNILTPAIEGAIGAMDDFFQSALENEQLQTRLESVIRSTGGAAGVTLDEANNLAAQFMDLAGGTDDAVLSIIEMGLRMGNITEDQMPAFIQTTLDLAAATGTDAVNAARLLAQAQEDPISALTRFRRMGIQFTETQEEQIKAMIEAGDLAGAQAVIMQRLGEATAGSAAAAADTLSGKWEILQGRLGEAGETIGMALLPLATQLFDNVIAPAIPVVEGLASTFGTFLETVLGGGDLASAFDALAGGVYRAFGPEAGLAVMQFGQFITGAIATIQENLPAVIATVQQAAQDLLTFFQPVISGAQNLAAAFVESMPMIQTYVQNMVTFVLEQINMLAPQLVANVGTALDSVATFWREHGETIMQVVNFAWRTISTTIGVVINSVVSVITAALQLINGDWEAAWQTIVTMLETNWNMILNIVGTNLEEFKTTWSTNWNMAVTIVTTLWGQMVTAIQTKVGEIRTTVETKVTELLDWLRGLRAQLEEIGRNIIDGIKGGILAAAGGLIAAATGAVTDAIAAAKALLGINSPSKVFAGIGANMMAGMALGISGNAHLPAAAAAGAAQYATYSTQTVNVHDGAIRVSGAQSPRDTATEVARELRGLMSSGGYRLGA